MMKNARIGFRERRGNGFRVRKRVVPFDFALQRFKLIDLLLFWHSMLDAHDRPSSAFLLDAIPHLELSSRRDLLLLLLFFLSFPQGICFQPMPKTLLPLRAYSVLAVSAALLRFYRRHQISV